MAFFSLFQIVSGSDDRTARIWDLRNMRSPVATIQSDSAVNRLAVSSNGLLGMVSHKMSKLTIFGYLEKKMLQLPFSSKFLYNF